MISICIRSFVRSFRFVSFGCFVKEEEEEVVVVGEGTLRHTHRDQVPGELCEKLAYFR